MERYRPLESANEKQLFHGTSKHSVGAICKQNFDWRVPIKNGNGLYGQGIYFAKNASDIWNITQNQVSVIIATCFWPGHWLVRTPSAHVVTVDRHVNITSIPRVICTIRAWTTWRIRQSSLSSSTINAIQNTLSSISRWRALMAFSEELVHLGRHHLRYPGDNFRRHIPRFKDHQNHCHHPPENIKGFSMYPMFKYEGKLGCFFSNKNKLHRVRKFTTDFP